MFCTGRQDTPQETLRGILLYGPLDLPASFPRGIGAGGMWAGGHTGAP